jgi:hypothetical protein
MKIKKVYETTVLDQAIEDATRMLDPQQDDYLKMIGALERLYELKEKEEDKKFWKNLKNINPDTTASIIGNLVGILLILHYEHIHVLTSKALNFVNKLR